MGDQFAAIYLGATRVPTVPGKPVPSAEWDAPDLIVYSQAPPNGGSVILQYRVYVNGEVFATVTAPGFDPFLFQVSAPTSLVGDTLRLSAINAIGEGPQSEPTTVEAVT
jgi:hypothetical protein